MLPRIWSAHAVGSPLSGDAAGKHQLLNINSFLLQALSRFRYNHTLCLLAIYNLR